MDDLSFQPLGPGDEALLSPLMQELYIHEAIAWHPESAAQSLRELLGSPVKGRAWLVFADRQAAGYFVLTLAFSLEFGGTFALLDELYIREEWRGRGVGTRTMDFATDESKKLGAHALRLEVGHANEGALKFYRRHGFSAEQRHLLTLRLG